MVILGLLLVLVGVLVILAGLFTTDVSAGGQVEALGIGIGAPTLFVFGVVAGVLVLVGFSVTKYGAKRGLRQRREAKRIDELSRKLDRAEAERNRDLDDDRR